MDTRTTITALLLSNIPRDLRSHSVREAAQALTSESTEADVGVVVSLVKLCQDEEAQQALISHLRSSIVGGDATHAVSICKQNPDIRASLLNLAVQFISSIPEQLRRRGFKWLAVTNAASNGSVQFDETDEEATDATVVLIAETIALLRFLTQVSLEDLHYNAKASLLTACCALVGAADHNLCINARDCIFQLFKLHAQIVTSFSDMLWTRIHAMIASTETFHQQIGQTLWLHWNMSEAIVSSEVLRDTDYWKLLANGLRAGDSERRKSCLQILQASVTLAAEDPSLVGLVTSLLANPDPEDIQRQYNRFCTVFETVVLGRYLNQVQECEADLDFLSSQRSCVNAVWFFALLAAALNPNLQDSNRKFIGSWIMRSSLRDDDLPANLEFFQDAFLPWAAQGHLFTSSLRLINGHLRCTHGDALAKYCSGVIVQVAGSDLEFAHGVVDAILLILLRRKGTNFAYAKVYLLEALGQALERQPSLQLNTDQVRSLEQLLHLTSLPEIARDYVKLRCWKLFYVLSSTNTSFSHQASQDHSYPWLELRDAVQQLGNAATSQVCGTVVSWDSQLSNREINEQKVIQKCSDLSSEIHSSLTQTHDPVNLNTKLHDIWTDLEYLEYPKDLLLALPKIVLDPKIISIAALSQERSDALSHTISTIIASLLDILRTRAYLLSPLVGLVRKVSFHQNCPILPFNLEDFIVHLTESLPTPTVDERLEDSTATLLQSLDPALNKLTFEYYFGPRRSYGIAVFLDLVSRLHALKPDVTSSLLERLLGRWTGQKIPPPSVSPWKNALQLQVILLCAEQVVPNASTEQAGRLLEDLQYVLSIEPLPRYRFLLEWMIVRLYLHHPRLRVRILEELKTKDHHANPKFLASLAKIGVRVAKTEASDEDFATSLASMFVPLAASSKVVVRHEAQWQIPALLDHAKRKSWSVVIENKAFAELDAFIRSLERFEGPPLERRIDVFDAVFDHTMTNLVEGPWFELDDIEQRLCRRSDFEQLFASDAACGDAQVSLPPSCISLGPTIPAPLAVRSNAAQGGNHERRMLQNVDDISRALGSGPGPAALQTKGAAYLAAAPARHPDLFVVASLVDNLHNLGGLSRVSEIFGASAMYLANLQATSSRDFTAVSVTSHLHLPLRALAADGVAAFVAARRRDAGFAVVGIEQTDRSVLLGSPACALPEKCILVVGSEREGIPALVLSECDMLVEIPQVGVTRSLNVQTAAGIVLCEYVRQHQRAK